MPVTGDRERVLADLEAEGTQLDRVVTARGVQLDRPTPSISWTIGHQIGHLHWTDRISALACRDPLAFARRAEQLGSDAARSISDSAAAEAARPADELIAAWRQGRTELLVVLEKLPSDAKIAWFGPSMSVESLAASRIMETWAHGLDVTDSLGLPPAATARLRHIAGLGTRTRDFAFSLHGRRSPGSPFRIELTAPDGETWSWGPPKAPDRITGPALDFCLLVTQRRNRQDLELVATKGAADQWLDIAQVFAGPAGAGRSPRAS